ncbi:Ger(x)C family spore germination protein [Gracilibacillus sp. HCP3S3_G5_1]|uniref:Ger(x)C family spore germination protein n=1 Tax=unclassified Gracilibacillus TaxID=2625209 RepID=UPI003F8C1273
MSKKLVLMFLLILLTGCYDRVELEEQSYVIAIGIDNTDQKGIYSFNFQIANPEMSSTVVESDESKPRTEIVTVNGSDILSATYTANSFVPKKIVLDQTRVIIISEEAARDEDFIRVIQTAARSPQIRRGVQMIVSKETAMDFIHHTTPLLESRPHKYYQFMLAGAIETGIIPDATLHRFFQITEGDDNLFLAMYATTEQSDEKTSKEGFEDEYIAGEVPQIGGSPTQFMGAAVFKEGQMIDVLTGEENRLTNMLDYTQQLNNYVTTIPDPFNPEYRLTYVYSQHKNPDVNITYHKDKPSEIDVDVYFKVEILSIPSLVRYSQNKDRQKVLEQSIIRRLNEKTNALIKKTQEEYRSDPFYWSLYFRKHFKDIPAYEEADWHQKIYPEANINVTYHLAKLEFGKMIDDTELHKVRD